MNEILLVFIGGGIGSVMRYCGQNLINPHTAHILSPFSWGTFFVNVTGCFLIGLLYSFSERWQLGQETRILLTTGLCGGFTTFSTFSNEGLLLLKSGCYVTFLLYIIASIIIGLAATWLGGYIGNFHDM